MTASEAEEIRLQWKSWKYHLEANGQVCDFGNPFGDGRRVIHGSDNSVTLGFTGDEFSPNGYIVIVANDLDEAQEISMGCPHLKTGGSVEVREVIQVNWRD